MKFKAELLVAPDLVGWTHRCDDDDQYVVWGPCPHCGGDVFAPDSPDVGDIVDAGNTGLLTGDAAQTSPVATIYARCNCGTPHGVVGATGCGRYWIVEVL